MNYEYIVADTLGRVIGPIIIEDTTLTPWPLSHQAVSESVFVLSRRD